MNEDMTPMSAEELAAEAGTALPDKEVMSVLDLNANLDLALDAAAPIDLAVGANANIAAPIEASAGANVLSLGSTAGAETTQVAGLHQGIVGDATATTHQQSGIDQGGTGPTPTDGSTGTTEPTPAPTTSTTTGSVTDGNLLNVNVDLNGKLGLAAPIDGAVAANANAAAPIDAAVSANIGSVDSNAVAVSQQEALIDQSIQGDATATGDQTSSINQ